MGAHHRHYDYDYDYDYELLLPSLDGANMPKPSRLCLRFLSKLGV